MKNVCLKNDFEEEERTSQPVLLFSQNAKKTKVTFNNPYPKAKIETERLELTPAKSSEVDEFMEWRGDQESVEKYADTLPRTREQILNTLQYFENRWDKDNYLSLFKVRLKAVDESIGQVALEDTEEPGVAELSYLFKKYQHNSHLVWGKGYGSEAINAVVKDYVPEPKVKACTVLGQPLAALTATARTDNPGSYKILQNLGMTFEKEEVKWEAKRYHYRMKV